MTWLFTSGDQNIAASATVLPMNIQGLFPLELADLIPLQSKGLSRVFSSTQFKSISSLAFSLIIQFSHLYITLTIWILAGKMMSLLFNTLFRFVIAFLPRSKLLLISWLQSLSAVIFGAQENKICHCFHFLPIYLP